MPHVALREILFFKNGFLTILSEWIIIQCCELDFLVLTFVLIKLCDRFINSTRIVCDDTIQANNKIFQCCFLFVDSPCINFTEVVSINSVFNPSFQFLQKQVCPQVGHSLAEPSMTRGNTETLKCLFLFAWFLQLLSLQADLEANFLDDASLLGIQLFQNGFDKIFQA